MDGFECEGENIESIASENTNNIGDDLEVHDIVETVSDSSNGLANSATCHYFFPTAEAVTERNTLEAQIDPLAFSNDGYEYESRPMSINDESLSIIDSENNADDVKCVQLYDAPENELKEKVQDINPKRKHSNLNSFGFFPVKKVKIKEELISSEEWPLSYAGIKLKKAVVNIGPKLPLPFCLKSKVIDDEQYNSYTNSLFSNPLKCTKVGHTLEEVENLVLKIYSCSICNEKHTNLLLHKAHVSTCKNSAACGVQNYGVCSYKDKKGLFCCEFCTYKFMCKENLISHQKKHFNTKGFSCSHCELVLFSVRRLQIHYNKCHKNLPRHFCCNICDYKNTNAKGLKDHMIKHNSDKFLYCRLCKQNYENNENFDKHLQKMHTKNHLQRKKLQGIEKFDEKKHKNDNIEKFALLKYNFESETIKKKGVYHCNGCVYTFSKLDHMVEHKKKHLQNTKPYNCPECAYESFSVSDLAKHSVIHFPLPEVMSVNCNICDMTFSHWKYLRRHAVYHIYDELYCFACRVNFEDSECLSQHMASFHNHSAQDTMHCCSMCSFKHPNKSTVKNHNNMHSRQKENSTRLIKEEPSQNLSSISKFAGSVDSSCRSKEKSCSLKIVGRNSSSDPSNFQYSSFEMYFDNAGSSREKYNQKYNQEQLLKSTQILLSKKEQHCLDLPFKCNKCNHECFGIDALIDHSNYVHMKNKEEFTCSVCFTKISSLKGYMLHVNLHKIRTYCCQYCNYQSRKRKFFLQHVIRHKAVCCPLCTYSTHNLQSLKDHINSQHTPGNEAFSCSLCPYNARNKNYISIHALKFHPTEYPSLKLPVPKHLRKVKEVQGVKVNACSFCQVTYGRTYEFKRHLSRHFKSGSLIRKGVQNKQSLVQKVLNKISNGKAVKAPLGTSSFYYSCYQCNFTHTESKHVSYHLLKVHKLKGGVRNNMVLKSSNSLSSNTGTPKLESVKSVTKPTSQTKLPLSLNVHTVKYNGQENKDFTRCTTMKAFHYVCSQCNFTHTLSKRVSDHLSKVHKIKGGVRNNMVLKSSKFMFNDTESRKSKSDISFTKQPSQTKTSSNLDLNLTKYNVADRSIFGLKSSNSLSSSTKSPVLEHEKSLPKYPSHKKSSSLRTSNLTKHKRQTNKCVNRAISTNVSVYKCSLCSYKHTKSSRVSDHIRVVHKMKGGVKNNLIQKSSTSSSNLPSITKISTCEVQSKKKCSFQKNHSSNLNILNPTYYNCVQENKSFKDLMDTSAFHFACSQCSFKSKHRRSVSQHLSRIHNIKGGVRNNMILKKISAVLNNPTKSQVQNEKSLTKCSDCEIHKLSITAQKQHKRWGHTLFWAKPLSCPKCNARFIKDMNLNIHQCLEKNTFLTCKVCCNYKTNLKTKMRRHTQTCTKSQLSKGRGLKSQISTSKQMLKSANISRQHIDISTPPFINTDNEMLKSSNTSHQKLHNSNQEFTNTEDEEIGKLANASVHQLDISTQGFIATEDEDIFKSSNKSHQQINTLTQAFIDTEDDQFSSDDESFSCGECNYVTVDVTDLIKHMFVHSGIQDD